MEKLYFADRVERFIALAPCVYLNRPPYSYEEVVEMFNKKINVDNEPYFSSLFGFPVPTKQLLHHYQIALQKRFQDFIPFDEFAGGKVTSDLVGLSKIDLVPLTLIAGSEDKLCNMDDL